MKKNRSALRTLCLALAVVALAVFAGSFFLRSVDNLEEDRREAGAQQLEEAVRRAAVSCYASEGFYPPSLAYLQEHYGIQVDEERYYVFYEIFAENLMPDITVVEHGYEN